MLCNTRPRSDGKENREEGKKERKQTGTKRNFTKTNLSKWMVFLNILKL
jgi:hypothetical protein